MSEASPERQHQTQWTFVIWYMEHDPSNAEMYRVMRQCMLYNDAGDLRAQDVACFVPGLSWIEAGAEVYRRIQGLS